MANAVSGVVAKVVAFIPTPPIVLEQDMEHHPDCDHWRVAHKTESQQVSHEGRGMWQARCTEPGCDWRSSLVGPDARCLVPKQEQEHGNVWTQCVGECSTWENEEAFWKWVEGGSWRR